ncbi:hypothetical protein ACFOU2_12335 [Bacillus songklensis]|uniref:DUF721 domain-containing protein n=1 Tax=Bacillus songklensis TaxID=1069116 RepID=A0ABV8B4J7_9BACI
MSKQRKEFPVHHSIAEMILNICFEEYKRKFDRRMSLLHYNLNMPAKQRHHIDQSAINLDVSVAVPLTRSLLIKCEELQQMLKQEFQLLTGLNVQDVRIRIQRVLVE